MLPAGQGLTAEAQHHCERNISAQMFRATSWYNFGHGHQRLSSVLATLAVLAFLIDQVQVHCCPMFRQALWLAAVAPEMPGSRENGPGIRWRLKLAEIPALQADIIYIGWIVLYVNSKTISKIAVLEEDMASLKHIAQ